MSFVEEFCFHCPYTEEVAKECHEFHCGEADLDDFYVNPPKDEEQRLMRLANPIKLETRLMFTDLLKE